MLDPLHGSTPGQIYVEHARRHVLLTDGTIASVSPSGEVHVDTSISLFGRELVADRPIFEAPLVQWPLEKYPDVIPGWQTLARSNGGLVQYIDRTGKLVAHEELCTVSEHSPNGAELPVTHRWVTGLRVDHERNTVEYISHSRSVVSLAIPDPWINSRCSRIAVYPYASALRHAEASINFPGTDVERRVNHGYALCEAAMCDFLERITQSTIAAGMARVVEQVEELSANLTDEGIKALRGDDREFEAQLKEHKEFFEAVCDFKQTFHRLVSQLAYSPEENAATILAQLQGVFTNTASDAAAVFDDFSKVIRTRQAHDELTTNSLALAERIRSLYESLYGTHNPRHLEKRIELYRLEAPDDVLTRGAQLTDQATISERHRINGEFRKAMQGRGGFVTNEYTTDYLRGAIKDGATLAVLRKQDGQIKVFCLFYPSAESVGELRKIHPDLDASRKSYYDVLCCAPGVAPTDSLILNRAIFVALQHSHTEKLISINHESNEASLRAAFGMGDYPGMYTIVRTVDGITTKYLQITVPVSSRIRSLTNAGTTFTRAEHNHTITRVREEVQPSSSGSITLPSPDELSQMQSLANLFAQKGFYRLSLGVASMSEQARSDLHGLVNQGAFDGMDGLVVVGAGRLAQQHGEHWVIRDVDALSLVNEIRERNSCVTAVGMAPYNIAGPEYGSSRNVIAPDGTECSMAVLVAEQAQEISVADPTSCLVIKNPVTIPTNSTDNMDVWHVEALRAMTFARHFKDPLFVFGAGGGVIAWEIKTVAEAITNGHIPGGRIVLLKGLGGSTDRLAEDKGLQEIAEKHLKTTGKPLVTIIDVHNNPHELRDSLTY